MTTSFKEKLLKKIKDHHNSQSIIKFYEKNLEKLEEEFEISKVTSILKEKGTRIPKTDLETLQGCINLLYNSMILANEIAFDKIKEKSFDVICSLTLTSLVLLMVDETDSLFFNEVLFQINYPKDEIDYFKERELIYYFCFVKLPCDVYGADGRSDLYLKGATVSESIASFLK